MFVTSPVADLVSLLATLRVESRAVTTLTLMAAFLPRSRWGEPDATNVVTCSKTLSWTLAGVRGKTNAKSWMAMLTASVAGGPAAWRIRVADVEKRGVVLKRAANRGQDEILD